MRLFHYTTALHLPFILATGALLPSRADAHGAGQRGVLWFSSNTAMERTVVKRRMAGCVTPPYIRWRVSAPEALHWPQIGRHAHYPQHTIRGLEQAGRRMGGIPGEWWGQLDRLSLSDCPSLEVRHLGAWRVLDPMRLSVTSLHHPSGQVIRMTLDGRPLMVVLRKAAADGAWAYATDTATAEFERLGATAVEAPAAA